MLPMASAKTKQKRICCMARVVEYAMHPLKCWIQNVISCKVPTGHMPSFALFCCQCRKKIIWFVTPHGQTI